MSRTWWRREALQSSTARWPADKVPVPPARDLGRNLAAAYLDLTITGGNGTRLPGASGSAAGLLTSTDKAKLDGIESGATADQTAAEIKTAYESNASTNAYTNTDRVKVGRLPSAACPNNQILKSNGAAFTCQADQAGAGGGLNAAGVRALIADPAETGNADRWSKTKLPTDVAYGPHFRLSRAR